MDLLISTENLQRANSDLLFEILAFQNVIVEMLINRNQIFSEKEINEKIKSHSDRIIDGIYAQYGHVPNTEVKNKE